MNWNIFYLINKEFLDLLFVAAIYAANIGLVFLSIKISEDDNYGLVA